MKNIGGYLVLFGLGSLLLGLFGYDFILVSWMDSWGYGPGIAMRIGMIVLGGILWFVGHNQEQTEGPGE